MNVNVLYKLVSTKHMEGIAVTISLEIKYGDHDAEYLFGSFQHTLKDFTR